MFSQTELPGGKKKKKPEDNFINMNLRGVFNKTFGYNTHISDDGEQKDNHQTKDESPVIDALDLLTEMTRLPAIATIGNST